MKVVLLMCLAVLCNITGVLSKKKKASYQWKIINPDYSMNTSTYKTVGYVGNQKSLLIQVKASRDGHLLLSESTDLSQKLYEWVLGGAGNLETLLRTPIFSFILSVKINPGMLAGNKWRWFWMDWSDGEYLKVGEGMNIHDPASVHLYTPLENTKILKFLSLSAYGNTVFYKLPTAPNPCFLPLKVYNKGSPNPSCAKEVQGEYLHTITNPVKKLSPSTYHTVGFVGGQTSLLIQIKGDRDAHLLFSRSATDLTKHVFEHVIGGWYNTETHFRSPIFGRLLTIRRRQFNALNATEFRWFWVNWSDGLVIKAGVGSNPADFKTMNIVTTRKFQDPPVPMRYLSLSAYGNTVQYKILRAANQCYLTLDEYKNRVKCLHTRDEKKCIAAGCCWDSFYIWCYQKA